MVKLRSGLNKIALPALYLLQVNQGQGIDNSFFKSIGGLFGAGGGPAGQITIGGLISIVVQLMLLIAASIAVIFLMLGGYRYVIARGNEEATEAAKKTMTGAVWGLIIIVMAFAIIRIIAAILIEGQAGTGIR